MSDCNCHEEITYGHKSDCPNLKPATLITMPTFYICPGCNAAAREIIGLKAQRDRLEAALRAIDEYEEPYETWARRYPQFIDVQGMMFNKEDIARAALAEV